MFAQNRPTDLERSYIAVSRTEILLSSLGLRPSRPNDVLFFATFIYFVYEMFNEYIDLFIHVNDLERVILNLMENTTFTGIMIRLTMLRRYRRIFGELIDEVKNDFNADKYENDDEIRIIVAYHDKSRLFMKLLVMNTGFTAISFYAKPLLENAGEIMNYTNDTTILVLPYHFHVFYELNDATTYFWTYLSQGPFVYVSWMGQSASDCLMIVLVYHVSGRMAVLSRRIVNIDPYECTRQFNEIVRDHDRLLRMGDKIEKAFSTILLCHLGCATLIICLLGYQILICLAHGERAVLVSLFSYMIVVLLILFALCTIADTLITESTRLCQAYYDCDWYKMTVKNSRTIVLCMARSQKPLRLTAGKITVFCLATFTSTVRASMGYLSVLRTVM